MNYNKPIEKMDTRTQTIYQELINGTLDKKAIANKYKVTLNEVMTIAKRYAVGSKKPQAVVQTTTPPPHIYMAGRRYYYYSGEQESYG